MQGATMTQALTRQTKTKQKIISVLETQNFPIGLEKIHHLVQVSLPKTAFSTVFRQVKKLEEAKEIIRTDWRERGSQFELANRPHHHHIACQICGRQADINDTVLNFNRKAIEKLTGYTIGQHIFELEGICPDCRSKN
jgi:Fur family ferric uptake transcriptional regulator